MTRGDRLAAWRRNPFFVLEVDITASTAEIERAGQRLLAMLRVGAASASCYETPLGIAMRDADAVREALALLRDPHQRIIFEILASLSPCAETRLEQDLAVAAKVIVEAFR
jgi:hypothetical protein